MNINRKFVTSLAATVILSSSITLTSCHIDVSGRFPSVKPPTDVEATYNAANVKTALNNVYDSLWGYQKEDTEETPDTASTMAKPFASDEKKKENASLNHFTDLLLSGSKDDVNRALYFSDGEVAMYTEMATYFAMKDNFSKNVWHNSELGEMWGSRKLIIRLNYDNNLIYCDFVVDDTNVSNSEDIVIHTELNYNFKNGDFHLTTYYAHTDKDVHESELTVTPAKRYELTYSLGQIQTYCYTSYGAQDDYSDEERHDPDFVYTPQLFLIAADRKEQKYYYASIAESDAHYDVGFNVMQEGWTKEKCQTFFSGINDAQNDEYMKNWVLANQSRNYAVNNINNLQYFIEQISTIDNLPDSSYKTYFNDNKATWIKEAKQAIIQEEINYFTWKILSGETMSNGDNSPSQILEKKAYGVYTVEMMQGGEVESSYPSYFWYDFINQDEQGNYVFAFNGDTRYTDKECTTPLTLDDVQSWDFNTPKNVYVLTPTYE